MLLHRSPFFSIFSIFFFKSSIFFFSVFSVFAPFFSIFFCNFSDALPPFTFFSTFLIFKISSISTSSCLERLNTCFWCKWGLSQATIVELVRWFTWWSHRRFPMFTHKGEKPYTCSSLSNSFVNVQQCTPHKTGLYLWHGNSLPRAQFVHDDWTCTKAFVTNITNMNLSLMHSLYMT